MKLVSKCHPFHSRKGVFPNQSKREFRVFFWEHGAKKPVALPEDMHISLLKSEITELSLKAGIKISQLHLLCPTRNDFYSANAGFCLERGNLLYFSTDCLELPSGERRGIIAHELGHLRFPDFLILKIFMPLSFIRKSVQKIARTLFLPIFRLMETRADIFSTKLTGNPQYLIDFFHRIESIAKDGFFSPHPPTRKRIARLEKLAQKMESEKREMGEKP